MSRNNFSCISLWIGWPGGGASESHRRTSLIPVFVMLKENPSTGSVFTACVSDLAFAFKCWSRRWQMKQWLIVHSGWTLQLNYKILINAFFFLRFSFEAHHEGIDPPIVPHTVFELCVWECKTDPKPTFTLNPLCWGCFFWRCWCHLQASNNSQIKTVWCHIAASHWPPGLFVVQGLAVAKLGEYSGLGRK